MFRFGNTLSFLTKYFSSIKSQVGAENWARTWTRVISTLEDGYEYVMVLGRKMVGSTTCEK